MPENTHYVEVDELPDRIVALTTSELDPMRREYVSAELHESVCAANDAWQTENAKLRELVVDLYDFYCVDDDGLGEAFEEEVVFSANVCDRMRKLGIEVDK